MNYLRGAVSAISAPYHYYNQINPSTLTGAIDVIVVQRPAKDGGTELACSPFHVRFGKWQVLRPSDKRVNVSVNGNPIPYDMKIGDAGEAFFVFETDDDVPEELMTSPLLQATHTEGESAAATTSDGRDGEPDLTHEGVRPRVTSEPDFLDLDALPMAASNDGDGRSTQIDEQDKRADEALSKKHPHDSGSSPDVDYRKDVTLDMEGYHAGARSERTPKNAFVIPSFTEHVPSDFEQEPPRSTTPSTSSCPASSDSGHSTRRNSLKLYPFPSFRATSEPPPDVTLTSGNEPSYTPSTDTMVGSSFTSPGPSSPSPSPPPIHAYQRHQQEYSWEWGGFPTPSPINAAFPVKGKEKRDSIIDSYFSAIEEEGDDADNEDNTSGVLDGKLRKRGRKKSHGRYKLDHNIDLVALVGGRLRGDESHPARFILDVGDFELSFELSLVPSNDINTTDPSFSLNDLDKDEAVGVFDQGKVNFQAFLNDESIVKDKRLIMRWADRRYITRRDNAALMDTLEGWRTVALRERQYLGTSLSSDAPVSGPAESRPPHMRSKSEPPEEARLVTSPTIVNAEGDTVQTKFPRSSWSWWRSRKSGVNIDRNGNGTERSTLQGSATAPPMTPLHRHEVLKTPKPERRPELEPIASPIPQRPPPAPPRTKYAKTLRLTSDQLKALNLKLGTNSITFSLSASGTIACTARIFVWEHTEQVVISDIDGTITKSDGLGHVFAMLGRDWTHLGVAKLYTDIVRNGYKIMYLTSRAIGQADATRYYLKGIKQDDYQLPEGPVIMSPDRLMASLHREVIMRKPEVFKMACLRDVRNLFGEANCNPFYAGFGNRITDALSYRSVNVPSSRIFTIDTSGDVRMELLELAGYKSSYIHMTDLVDQMFPPINKKWTPEYTDFNFWRNPIPDIQLPDITPPSPALSARSDGSTTSALAARLKTFSLGGNKERRNQKDEKGNSDPRKNVHTRLSSLERLSSSLADGFRLSMSPDSRSESSTTYAESDADSDGEWGVGGDGKRRTKLERRRSIGSMPGSLDDMHFFGLDDYDENQLDEPVFGEFEQSKGPRREDHQDKEEVDPHEGDLIADELALEEDLFVAGEMQNVPFL